MVKRIKYKIKKVKTPKEIARIQKKKKLLFAFYKSRRDFNYSVGYNVSTVGSNSKASVLTKKHRKMHKVGRPRKLDFYFQFPRLLNKKQPLVNFYKVNLELLAINYDLLLSFHAAIGNSSKNWVNPTVFSSVLAIRDNMILFDLSMIFIRLKKGLQVIFQIAKQKGSILGFVDINNNYKFSGSGFEHFLRNWLGGYLTNFKFVTKNLISLKKNKFMNLTRRQQKFFQNLVVKREVSIKYYYAFFKLKKNFRDEGLPKDFKKKIPAVPQFGFSLEDHSIWLNESHRVANNVMCVCDSQSFPQKVDFPLIANQKSLPLSFFLVKVVTEALFCGKRMDYFSFWGFPIVASHRK